MAQAIKRICGCTTLAFQDPAMALGALTAEPNRFSSVVTDYDMPGMNGIAFAQCVRAIAGMQHVPIVMVTSFDQRRIRRDALEAGVTDFMGKPFDASEVKARLTNLLALDAARRSERDRSAWLAHEVALATRTIREREREIVIRLARAAEYRDTDTGNHVARVALLARSIALELGVRSRLVRRPGTRLHDARRRQDRGAGFDPAQARPAQLGGAGDREATRRDRLRYS